MTTRLVKLRIVVAAAGVLAVGVIGWNALRPLSPVADWLIVEAPPAAVMNRPASIRVTLPPQPTSGWLGVDFHQSSGPEERRGYLSGAPARRVETNGGVFEFEAPVPVRSGLSQVRAIVFLGASARWADRQRAAETETILVRPEGSAPDDFQPRPIRAYELAAGPTAAAPDASGPRILGATLWAAAGMLAWRRRREEELSRRRERQTAWAGQWLTFACLAVAFLELTAADRYFAEGLRSRLVEAGLYRERRWPQQAATLLAIAGVAGLGWLAFRRIKSPARSTAALCLGLFALLSLVGLFSLHQLDGMLSARLGPMTWGQAGKLLCAGLAALALGCDRAAEAAGETLARHRRDDS